MNKKLVVRQNGYKDCGPSCLLSIMRYYGLDASHEEVSYILKTDINGTNAYNIINGSRTFGFDGYGIHYSYDEIINNEITFPIICHVQINNMLHFIVVYKIKKDKLIIMDPASSINKIDKNYFKKIYLNTSLVIYPVKKIKKINSHTTLLKLIKDYLKIEKYQIIKIIILSIFTIILSIITNYYSMINIDIILPNFNYNKLIKISIIFLNIYIIRNIFNYYKNKYMFEIENNILLNINNDIIRKYFNLPYQFFKTKSTGEIISRLNDISLFKTLFSQTITNLASNSLLIIISMIILLNLNSKLFIINIIEIILYFITVFLFRNKFKLKSEEILISNGEYEKTLTESIYGYETNKNLNLLNEVIKKIEIKHIKNLKKIKNYETLSNRQLLIKEIITNISYLLTITLGILYVYNKTITLGELILYNTIIYYFTEPIKELLDIHPNLTYMKNIFNRINDIIIITEKKEDTKVKNIKNDIIITKLSYKNGLNKLFENINANIKYGSKILVYGKSGVGKSTIMKILMKYIDDYEGEIYFGKINLKDISQNNIAHNITYISQNSYLNNDTLKNNIIYERKIKEEKYEKILEICNLKGLREDNILRNNFMIEENGFNLSGGERQKIILARSLLKESNYIIMDEALSEIGVYEEKEIIQKMFNYLKNKTVIYITHKKEIMELFKEKIKIERRKVNVK